MRIDLTGVPETMLWTLFRRALEARRPDTVLPDPRAVDLVDRLDYPFEERFGLAGEGQAQWQALRVRTFDRAVRDFLADHPDGTVVALGEGLETQFWRVDNGRMRWLTVELPEVAAVRRELLPDEERRRTLDGDIRDGAWLDRLDGPDDGGRGVLVTAQGVLMYLRPPEVRAVLADCAERLPGQAMVFDTVPRWFRALTLGGRLKEPTGYTTPPMPWAVDAGRLAAIATAHPNIASVREVPLPRGRGAYFEHVAPVQRRLPVVRNARPTVTVRITFGDRPGT